jgi:hypothetical protein
MLPCVHERAGTPGAVTKLALFVLSGWLGACSFIVDFDRSKIHHDHDASTDGGGVGDGDSDMDAQISADGSASDAAQPGTDAQADAGGGRCTEDTECTGGQVCCTPGAFTGTCTEATVAHCTSCDDGKGACDTQHALACTNNTCECVAGSGVPCSGAKPYCVSGTGGVLACVECRSDMNSVDCHGNPNGEFCVDGRCVECEGDQGCQGAKPICNTQNQCEACTTSPDNCPDPLECTAGVGCTGCTVGGTDCPASTPICKLASGKTSCHGCASNAECGTGKFCDEAHGPCYDACDPNNNAGCTTATKPYCKVTTTNGTSTAQCSACDASGSAPHYTCDSDKLCDTSSGACVECLKNTDCTSDEPFCDQSSHTCRPCTAATEAADCGTGNVCVGAKCVDCNGGANQCASGTPVCVSNMCKQCDSSHLDACTPPDQCQVASCPSNACAYAPKSITDNKACTVDACDPATGTITHTIPARTDCAENQCDGSGNLVAVATDANCKTVAQPYCLPSGTNAYACFECKTATDCGGTTPFCGTGHSCVSCSDPTSGGCGSNVCDTTSGKCVQCTKAADCNGTPSTPACVNNKCVPCASSSDCGGTTPFCNTTTNQCVSCATPPAGAMCPSGTTCGATGACVTPPPPADGGV